VAELLGNAISVVIRQAGSDALVVDMLVVACA
jgi:hypothetical protein